MGGRAARAALLVVCGVFVGACSAGWNGPEAVDEGDTPCMYASRDGLTLHVVYFKNSTAAADAETPRVLMYSQRNSSSSGSWSKPVAIAKFKETHSADIIGYSVEKDGAATQLVQVVVSAKAAGDERFVVYFLEKEGDQWSAVVRMLHNPDAFDRVSVNVLQDEGKVWVSALKAAPGAADSDEPSRIALWYREVGDRFVAEQELVGVAHQEGLTMAVWTQQGQKYVLLASSASSTVGSSTMYYDVVLRKQVGRPKGTQWTWHKEDACSAYAPMLIANSSFLAMLYIDQDHWLRAREFTGTWKPVGLLSEWHVAQTPLYTLMVDRASDALTIAVAGTRNDDCTSIAAMLIKDVNKDWNGWGNIDTLDNPSGGHCVVGRPTLSAACNVYALAFSAHSGSNSTAATSIYAAVYRP